MHERTGFCASLTSTNGGHQPTNFRNSKKNDRIDLQRRQRFVRFGGLSLFLLLATAILALVPSNLLILPSCTALVHPAYGGFISRAIQRPTRLPSFSRSFSQPKQPTVLHVSFSGWDDLLYQAESLANSWASISLQSSSSGSNSLLAAVPVMYGAGLLTSFSPCVWGLLPLTISYISAAAEERSDQQTLLPTVAFCFGLATVFCTLGIAAVSIGSVFGATASSTDSAFMASVSASMILPLLSNSICFLMGLKLLDLVNIPLLSFSLAAPINNPTSRGTQSPILLDASGHTVQSDSRQNPEEGNALIRTFLLGGSSALVASPCATPVLTSILAFVANSEATHGASIMGGLLLFFYTLGYSTPLFIVAATGGQALVQLKQQQQLKEGNFWSTLPNRIAPLVTPLTGGILLYLGTTGLLTTLLGDPSLMALTVLE